MPFKIFGAALDALDDPERVELKQAYLQAAFSGRLPPELPLDPYDILAPLLADRYGEAMRFCGKLELPGWLTPRPPVQDACLVRSESYRHFLDDDGVGIYAEACARYVERHIFPDIPCLISVDHGMTAGPLEALSRRFDPRETTVVVIDSHFDAIPAHLRSLPGLESFTCGSRNCGSFLTALIDAGAVLPENLFVVGVSDYAWPGTAEPYRRAYLAQMERGVTVITRAEVEEESFAGDLQRRLRNSRGSRLYVSLDADAGALRCMNAVRFLDTVGMSEESIIDLAGLLRGLVDEGRFELIGLDAAEMDVHLVGIEDEQGLPDRTVEVCADFLTTLMRIDA